MTNNIRIEGTNMSALREKLITEIQRIPDNRLREIFDVIHFFRLGLDSEQANKAVDVRQFTKSVR
jgi:hypothetical protein